MSYNESLNPSSNYPEMTQSQWDSAPFNQVDVPEEEFEVTCSQCLSKTTTVLTSDYIPGDSGVDYETDDEGRPYATAWHDDPDTSDTNWAEEYHANDHYTPIQLIELFGKYLKNEINYNPVLTKAKIAEYEYLIEECSGWTEDETEYVKD